LTDLVASHPAVMQFYFVTGTNDYVAILSVGSMEEYDTFMATMVALDPKILTDTNVVIRSIKMGLAILIDS
jgi:DNA-binding Lrp family transcriptional regulator